MSSRNRDRIKGGIIFAMSERAASGSQSRLSAYGSARKTAGRLSTRFRKYVHGKLRQPKKAALTIAEKAACYVWLSVAIGDPIAHGCENGLVLGFGRLGLIEAVGLVGAFALDNHLLLLDGGFALHGLGIGPGSNGGILRRRARDDFLSLGFPRVGGRLAGIGALFARGILGDLGFGDRLPFGKLGFGLLTQGGIGGDGLGLDALLGADKRRNGSVIVDFKQHEHGEEELHPAVFDEPRRQIPQMLE